MAALIQINDHHFDPTRVISVTDWEDDRVAINVDMNSWTATYVVDVETDGWDKDSIAEAVNKARGYI